MEKARSRFQLPAINGGIYRLINGAEGMIVKIPTTINNNFRAALYLSWEYSMGILLQRKLQIIVFLKINIIIQTSKTSRC